MTAALPERIGPYRVTGLLGQGAMSQVFRATLPLLGHQEYAVKLLRERCKPREVSAFLGECTNVKRLGTHPHIVPLYFAGRDRRLSRYYVVMELLQGATAARLLAEAPAHQLPVERAVRIAIQIALGLEHAHQRGLLHLDVKPSNILLEAEGALAKLGDFGSAQLQEEVATRAAANRMGAPAYRAWEQTPEGGRAGLAPDARSDVYGLAATLYHLLTGQVPQQAPDGGLLPPARWRGDLPPPLEAVLLDALSRDPAGRPATMEAFRRALEECAAPQRPVITSPLPISAARLVGRAPLLQTLKERLIAEETLAISALGGLPGVGKTALAAALANDPEIRAHFADGILWAALGKAPDLGAVLGAWGTALGISAAEVAQLRRLEEWSQFLRTRIGTRRMLLVIDDAWSIADALACQVGGPGCAHLLTTRATDLALQFAGAGLTPVPELSEPEGVELLAQLAPQVVADKPEEALALVRAVGGLPLGLVLLGKHLQLHSYGGQPRRIQTALERLKERGERLRVAQPQGPAAPHSSLPAGTPLSLSASIGLSDAALNSEARAMLRALAIFPPKPTSFSEEAALAVSGEAPETLDRLVDAGLVESVGQARYALHQTIADYACQQGQPGGLEERLATWAVSVVERQPGTVPALDLELPLLLAAFTLAAEKGFHGLLVRGVTHLAPRLEERGLYATAEQLLEQARRAARIIGEVPGELLATYYLAGVVQKRGEYARAEALAQEGLDLAREQRADEQLSALLHVYGIVVQKRGAREQAEQAFQEALTLARARGDGERIIAVLSSLGNQGMRYGNYAQAEAAYLEALSAARQRGERAQLVTILSGLAGVTVHRGDYQQARSLLQEALATARSLGTRQQMVWLLNNLGALEMEQGNLEESEQALAEGLALARELGYQDQLPIVLESLGEVLIRRGHTQEALAALEEGLTLAQALGQRDRTGSLLLRLAEIALVERAVPQAERWWQEGLTVARDLRQPLLLSHAQLVAGELALQQGQLDAATRAFDLVAADQESHRPEYLALADYGLARVAAAREQWQKAKQYGQASLTRLESIDSYKLAEVRRWLETLHAPG